MPKAQETPIYIFDGYHNPPSIAAVKRTEVEQLMIPLKFLRDLVDFARRVESKAEMYTLASVYLRYFRLLYSSGKAFFGLRCGCLWRTER